MNNERLAEVWQDHVRQVIVVWPMVWKHEPGGNWFVSHKFRCRA
ncbi:hypothetical protein ABIF07_001065 [Bradyrhizobium elkanii]|nr:hypothetical protein [Bradyrhizobium elkanii]